MERVENTTHTITLCTRCFTKSMTKRVELDPIHKKYRIYSITTITMRVFHISSDDYETGQRRLDISRRWLAAVRELADFIAEVPDGDPLVGEILPDGTKIRGYDPRGPKQE